MREGKKPLSPKPVGFSGPGGWRKPVSASGSSTEAPRRTCTLALFVSSSGFIGLDTGLILKFRVGGILNEFLEFRFYMGFKAYRAWVLDHLL